MKITCVHCGMTVQAGVRYCPSCGRELQETGNNEVKNSDEQKKNPGKEQGTSEKNTKEPDNNKRKIIAAGGILLLVVCAAALFAVTHKKPDIKPSVPVSEEGKTAESAETEEEGKTAEFAKTEEEVTTGAAAETAEEETTAVRAEPEETSAASEQTERMVAMIREDYNAIRNRTDSGQDDTKSYSGMTVYYYDNRPEMAVVPVSESLSGYTEYYYYKNGNLIFAYYEDYDSYRYYFVNEKLIRIRYCEEAANPQNAVNEDLGETVSDEFAQEEKRVLEYSRRCLSKIEEAEAKKAAEEEAARKKAEEEAARKKAEQEKAAGKAPAVSKERIESVSASSWKAEPEYDLYHVPENILDGDLSTGWCEDAKGNGTGETVTVYFDRECLVAGLYIYPGYHKSKDLFLKNGTPTKVRITGDHSEVFTLEDEMKRQKLTFSSPMTTDAITIEILEVREGSKYTDTLITDIKPF